MNVLDINSWNKTLDNMVFIGGSARSGTTIMGKLIHSLKNVEYQFEPPMLESLLLKQDELSEKSLKELLQFYFFDNFLLDSLAGRNINLNLNDDSCILHVKSQSEIDSRYERSLTRVELEELVKNTIYSFKLPEIVFFLKEMDKLFPLNKKILMHRNPNDVINSILVKGWFSNESLLESHSSQIFAVEIIDNIKIPYWVKNKDLWIKANEIDRCAYYYKRVSEEILLSSDKSLIVNYDSFIKSPKKVFENIAVELQLEYGVKTNGILDTVQYQKKERENTLNQINTSLLKDIEELDEQLVRISFQ